jgi:hypothetical protein
MPQLQESQCSCKKHAHLSRKLVREGVLRTAPSYEYLYRP